MVFLPCTQLFRQGEHVILAGRTFFGVPSSSRAVVHPPFLHRPQEDGGLLDNLTPCFFKKDIPGPPSFVSMVVDL